jgi:hypothetical protein
MLDDQGALSEWEWSAIAHANPALLRKRFRDELIELHRVGTLLEAITDNNLLATLLAYSWKHTYSLALVCKRFLAITRCRFYWTELAKHALKEDIPKNILEQVNFFHGLETTDPPHFFLHGLLQKTPRKVLEKGKSCEFYGLKKDSLHYCLKIGWKHNRYYYLSNRFLDAKYEKSFLHPVRTTHFHHPILRKTVHFMQDARHTLIRYVEIFDAARGQTWCGEPGLSFSNNIEREEQFFPGPLSMGVWK